MPNITVFIPAYNCEKYVGKAIQSVQNQTLDSWEILLFDDCSLDNTYSVAQSYALKDKRIKVYRNRTNLGMMGNWNKGIKSINTTYFVKLDGDDSFEPEALKSAYEILEENENIGLICSAYNTIDEISKKSIIHQQEVIHEGIFSALKLVKSGIDIFSSGISIQGIILLRTSIVQDYGVYKEHFWGDQEFWFRAGVKYDYYYIKKPLYNYRRWNSNITKHSNDYTQEYNRKKGFYDCRKAIFTHYLTYNKITNSEYRKVEKDIRFEWYKYLIYINRINREYLHSFWYLLRILWLKPTSTLNYYINKVVA